MDFEALFLTRIHYIEKQRRLTEKNLEFMWSASDSLGSRIFTGIFFENLYVPPSEFCFDATCVDEPIMDNAEMRGYNVDEKITKFIEYVKLQASFLRTNHVMLLMGGDFHYTNANMWYTNLDKLIEHLNKRENETHIRAFYSTPGCYYNAVKQNLTELELKTNDFFPYAHAEDGYWTGYFASRPTFKGFVRQSSSFLQLLKQLSALAMLNKTDDAYVDELRKAMATVQHHDSITGTAKEEVTRDYTGSLERSWNGGKIVIDHALRKLSQRLEQTRETDSNSSRWTLCQKIQETVCDATREMEQIAITVFNAYSQSQKTYIRIPYFSRFANITDFEDKPLEYQIQETFSTALRSAETAPYELFVPLAVPALGFTTVFVANDTRWQSRLHTKSLKEMKQQATRKRTTITNGLISLSFDDFGHLSTYKNLKNKQEVKLNQEFLYYESSHAWHTSGAYVFRAGNATPKSFQEPIAIQVEKGPLVSEVRQTVSPWVSQTVRLYKGKSYVEFEWTIGPLPKETAPTAKDVITRYSTDIASGSMFYTDANGRQMMARRRNHSPSFEYSNTEPVAGNYYPVNTRIFIKDSNTQMTVLTDRSQGGSSLKDGQIELMIHRRAFVDDGLGLGEALDEPGDSGQGVVVRGRHWLLFDNPVSAAATHRPLAFELLYSPILSFVNPLAKQEKRITQFTGLARALPEQVHIMTLEQWTGRDLLLRLEHIYQKDESKNIPSPTAVDLKGLFTTFEVTAVRELNLGANIYKNDHSDFRQARSPLSRFFGVQGKENFTVQLKPAEIRTFRLEIQDK